MATDGCQHDGHGLEQYVVQGLQCTDQHCGIYTWCAFVVVVCTISVPLAFVCTIWLLCALFGFCVCGVCPDDRYLAGTLDAPRAIGMYHAMAVCSSIKNDNAMGMGKRDQLTREVRHQVAPNATTRP